MSSRIRADIENLQQQVAALKNNLDAIILVHNYQVPEIQQIADIRGDSLELSRVAAETDADVIVFCGVQFMAETAAILSPDKKVLLPVKEAGCPMADMITVDGVRKLRAENPGAPVVCYVNSSAEVKAESDVCCTSANAVEVVNSLDEDRAIFIPDKHLGRYVAEHTDKDIITYQGFCPTHARLTVEDIGHFQVRSGKRCEGVHHRYGDRDALYVAPGEPRQGVLSRIRADDVSEHEAE
jgi:quinolinate synthase